MSEPLSLSTRTKLAHLRHQLRTPLNAIIGYSELLQEDTVGRGETLCDLRNGLMEINSAGDRLLGRVNALLDSTYIELNQVDIESRDFRAELRRELNPPIESILGICDTLLGDIALVEVGFTADLGKIRTAAGNFKSMLPEIEGWNSAALTFGEIAARIEGAIDTLATLEQATASEKSTNLQGDLLVVDDNEMNRDVLSRYLQNQGYSIQTASSGSEALEMLERKRFDLLLLDVMMPGMTGYEVLERLKADPDLGRIPAIMISSLDEIDSVVRCIELGAEDYLAKPFNPVLLQARVNSSLERKRLRDQEEAYRRRIEENNRQLESRVRQQVEQIRESWDRLNRALEETVLVLASVVERRDPYTAGHQQRVSQLACAIAGKMLLPASQIEGIRTAAILHDIGKIAIPTEILSKPGRLMEVEFNLIKVHSQVGYEILERIEFPWPVARVVRQHHERLDGSGYPLGLRGSQILLEACILGVADVVEAMSSHRPYRVALGMERAMQEIREGKGRSFEPQVVDACLQLCEGTNPLFRFS